MNIQTTPVLSFMFSLAITLMAGLAAAQEPAGKPRIPPPVPLAPAPWIKELWRLTALGFLSVTTPVRLAP